jgi:hypothetical protein
MVSTSNTYLLRELLFPFGPKVVQATLCTIIAISQHFSSVFSLSQHVSADSRQFAGPVEVLALQIAQFNMVGH